MQPPVESKLAITSLASTTFSAEASRQLVPSRKLIEIKGSSETKFATPKISAREKGEIEALLREADRNVEYEKILEDKDKAYALLFERFTKLKSTYEQGQVQVLSDFMAKTEQNEKLATATIVSLQAEANTARAGLKKALEELEQLKSKPQVDASIVNAEVAAVKAANTELQRQLQDKQAAAANEQLSSLEAANLALREQVKRQEEQLNDSSRLIETYRLLTATDVTHAKDDKFHCKLVRQNPFRVMEFELDARADDITFIPLKISLKGGSYPGYFKERITFEPNQTPLFMRNLLSTVYNGPQSNFTHTPSKPPH